MTNEKLTKSFHISSVCREDILSEKYPKKFVDSLEDYDMEYIASKMADAFCDIDTYWIALHTICDDMFEDFKKNGRGK